MVAIVGGTEDAPQDTGERPMERLAEGNQPVTLEEFEAAASGAKAAWEAAWTEGLPMPSSYRLPNPFGGVSNVVPGHAG